MDSPDQTAIDGARPLLARLNWYWLLQLPGWATVALINLWLASMYPGGPLAPALIAVCTWGGVSALLLSDAWHRVLKTRGTRPLITCLATMAAATVVLSCIQTLSVYCAYRAFKPYGDVRGYGWLPFALVFWAVAFKAWNLSYLAALSLRRARRAEAQALRLELQAKDVELRALQAQVNPHFFFNSLNSVRALIYEDRDSAARAIDQLAALMRYALQSGHVQTVPLAAELEAVHSYLAIEKIRFEERLRVHVDIEPGLERVMIPPMALQTLVENAVKYGVEMSSAGSDIRIRAWRAGRAALIEIANSGAIRRFAGSTQVGLANTRKRLALSVGAAARLELTENGGWVRATLQLPEAA